MTQREALLVLSSALEELISLLKLDAGCQWTSKFETDRIVANELLRNGFSNEELEQLALSVKYVYQGMGSFNDYSPGKYNISTRQYEAIPGAENFEEASQKVFDAANELVAS